MVLLNGLSKLETRILSTSFVGLAFCGFLLSSEAAIERLFRASERITVPHVRMAQAENVVGVVYVKPKGQGKLQDVEVGRDLFLGDAIRVDESARMGLKTADGVRVFVYEQSLFRFGQFSEGNLLSLDMGLFRLHLDGDWLASINGDPVRFSGQSARFEIRVLEDGNFSYRVISGEGSLTRLIDAGGETPQIVPGDPLQIYLWRFADIYESREKSLRVRPVPAQEVEMERELLWDYPKAGPFSVQSSADENFADQTSFLATQDKKLNLKKVKVGTTFWRVSFDQKRWSTVGRFTIEPRFLDIRAHIRVHRRAGWTVEFDLSTTDPDVKSFVVEISMDPDFAPETTEVRFSQAAKTLVHGFSKPSIYFVRARAMNGNQELSEPSEVLTIK